MLKHTLLTTLLSSHSETDFVTTPIPDMSKLTFLTMLLSIFADIDFVTTPLSSYAEHEREREIEREEEIDCLKKLFFEQLFNLLC
jgi:hypothetical protein